MFHVSAKTDYGLLLMVALAQQASDGPVSLRALADARRLPYRFLTQIVIPLRQRDLILAKEGVRGGYQLSRPASEISIGAILEALEGDIGLVRCLRHGEEACPSEAFCGLPSLWRHVTGAIERSLQTMSLADLVAKLPKPVAHAHAHAVTA